MSQEFVLVVGEVVDVEGKGAIFQLQEPVNPLLGTLKTLVDVFLYNGPIIRLVSTTGT